MIPIRKNELGRLDCLIEVFRRAVSDAVDGPTSLHDVQHWVAISLGHVSYPMLVKHAADSPAKSVDWGGAIRVLSRTMPRARQRLSHTDIPCLSESGIQEVLLDFEKNCLESIPGTAGVDTRAVLDKAAKEYLQDRRRFNTERKTAAKRRWFNKENLISALECLRY